MVNISEREDGEGQQEDDHDHLGDLARFSNNLPTPSTLVHAMNQPATDHYTSDWISQLLLHPPCWDGFQASNQELGRVYVEPGRGER